MTETTTQPIQGHLTKDAQEGYYYDNFPKDKWYIIRWLKAGGGHYFPEEDGQLPTCFNTKQEAIDYLKEWHKNFDANYKKEYKVVNGLEASNYPVPKRW
ncbi:MAG: hypothetical protein WC365_08970 [Candidatus Babeliales bacterium]|jgi:hypothetical protein